MVRFECPKVINPCVSFTFEDFLFPIFSPYSFLPFSLWGNKKWFIKGEAGLKGRNLLEQNQFNRLQKVQFECSKVRNPCVSFTFEEFPFPMFSPNSFLPEEQSSGYSSPPLSSSSVQFFYSTSAQAGLQESRRIAGGREGERGRSSQRTTPLLPSFLSLG